MMDTSMSQIQSYLKCQKAYEYRYVQGLRPRKETTDTMDIGTLFHAGAAAGYQHLGHINHHWFADAQAEVDRVIEEGYDYHGERRELEVSDEDQELVKEMLEYYWENVGKHDKFDEIIAVEEPFNLTIGGFNIRNTFDLVVRENGRVVVFDHKTVGNVKETAEFLPLDFQIGAYMLAASRHFGEPVEFVYNMIRRAVPRELTKSGRKSTSSKDPMDYVRRERLWKNKTELAAWEKALLTVTTEIDWKSKYKTFGVPESFNRSPQKGFMGCSGCAYKSICSAELIGQTVDGSMAEWFFTKEAA